VPEQQGPTHRAYAVIRVDGQNDFLLEIGLAFAHEDQQGFNVLLCSIPDDGIVVCKLIASDDRPAELQLT
jgi:hypothetical protein